MEHLAEEPASAAQAAKPSRSLGLLLIYSCAIFLGAFLQFLIQPLVGNAILPWFGGSAAVWGVCLVFFQGLLLVGYVYAHFLTQKCRFSQQLIVHGGLLVLSIFFLQVIPNSASRPPTVGHPVADILLTLAATVGLPYTLLSATSPLLQAWLARSRSAYPYRLYALSNLGSMLGLLGYPFAVQPAMGLKSQALLWSTGFIAFAVLCALAAVAIRPSLDTNRESAPGATKVSFGSFAAWVGLAACPSAMLVASTNVLCMDVASTPFLWVVPLAIYLMSLIICFSSPTIYERKAFGAISLGLLFMTAWAVNEKSIEELPLVQQLLLFNGCLFAVCMMFHGELVRRRPDKQQLTHFYLAMALGGVLGGAAVALLAPQVFESYLEFPVVSMVSAAFAAAAVTGLLGKEQRALPAFRARARQLESKPQPYWWSLRSVGAVVLVAAFALVQGGFSTLNQDSQKQVVGRDFYGVVSVEEQHIGDPAKHAMVMWHGRIQHGMQMLSPKVQRMPQLYFRPETGVGRLFPLLRETRPTLRVGIIGLGTGSLAGYGAPNDFFRFYEISPVVVKTAQDHFTFLKDCPAETDVVLGDARISLEHEASQQFDVFICDAFSSDSIPLHLLTKEAFDVYLKHLKPNGVMAFHITNSHVDLTGPLHALAREAGFEEVLTVTAHQPEQGTVASTWYILTRDRILAEKLRKEFPHPPAVAQWTTPWTDDRCDLLSVLK